MSEEQVRQNEIDPTELDLDALADEVKYVKFKGQARRVETPDVKELVTVLRVAKQFENFDKQEIDDDDPEEIAEAFVNLREGIINLVPDLSGEKLNLKQTMALMQLLLKMVVPADLKELERQGITLSDDQKKAIFGGFEKSPDSAISTPLIQSNLA